MIETTQAWKTALGCIQIPNRESLVPENDIKIEYEQMDYAAQSSGSIAVNSSADISKHSEALNRSIDYSKEKAITTCEPNEWVLDGSTRNYGADAHCGWISGSQSLSDGTFATNPKITLTWATEQTTLIKGLTIWWSSLLGEWASEFNITAKKNGSNVFDEDFTADNVQGFYAGELSGYDTIIIEIKKWCVPYRRARIECIGIGFLVHLGKSEIVSAVHSLSSDLLSFCLPDDSISFDIDNISADWNPDNPTGIYAYLTERQRVVVKYAYKLNGAFEWHTVGTYFMSEWTTPQNGITASFTARSLIEFMSNRFSPSSIPGYNFGDTISLKELAEAAFTQANLPTDIDGSEKWELADELDDIDVVIPYSTSTSEGVTTHTWNFDYTCAEVVQLCASAGCAVIRPNTNGDICVTLPDDTVTDYYIDGFKSFSAGEYDSTKPLKTVNINGGEMIYTPAETVANGVEQSIQNPLLQSATTRTAQCAFVSNLLSRRKTISGEFLADPRLQPLDAITVKNKYATNKVWITSCKWTYSGSFKGQYAGRVIKSIPLIEQSGWWYSGDIHAGGEW